MCTFIGYSRHLLSGSPTKPKIVFKRDFWNQSFWTVSMHFPKNFPAVNVSTWLFERATVLSFSIHQDGIKVLTAWRTLEQDKLCRKTRVGDCFKKSCVLLHFPQTHLLSPAPSLTLYYLFSCFNTFASPRPSHIFELVSRFLFVSANSRIRTKQCLQKKSSVMFGPTELYK